MCLAISDHYFVVQVSVDTSIYPVEVIHSCIVDILCSTEFHSHVINNSFRFKLKCWLHISLQYNSLLLQDKLVVFVSSEGRTSLLLLLSLSGGLLTIDNAKCTAIRIR